MTEFCDELFEGKEAELLAPFVTNLDRSIFCLRNLPEVVKGALFSRYSRSDKSLRRILLDEFIDVPESGFERIVAGAGANNHDQVVAINRPRRSMSASWLATAMTRSPS